MIKYFLQILIFSLTFLSITFIYSFYDWLIKWTNEYFFEFKYNKIHNLINIIIKFSDILTYVLVKLNSINVYNNVVDFLIIIKYLDIQLGCYYSYQFYFTFYFLYKNINLYLIEFINEILNIY
jgi:hypothetical protein